MSQSTHPAPAPAAPPTSGAVDRFRGVLVPTIRRLLAREPGLVAVGLAGLVIAAVCLVGVIIEGQTVAPEGKLLDAATFCFGVGMYTLTIALVLPLAGYSAPTRRRWRRIFYVYPVYGLSMLGQPSRWVHVASVGWLTAGLAALAQAVLGRPPLEPSILSTIIVLGLAVWAGVVVRVGAALVHAPRWRTA